MTEITDKTKVLVSRAGDFWINQAQADRLTDAMNSENPSAMIQLEGNFINLKNVDAILTADKYQEYNLKRRGGWQCKYQHWHERNQQCAHHMAGSEWHGR